MGVSVPYYSLILGKRHIQGEYLLLQSQDHWRFSSLVTWTQAVFVVICDPSGIELRVINHMHHINLSLDWKQNLLLKDFLHQNFHHPYHLE